MPKQKSRSAGAADTKSSRRGKPAAARSPGARRPRAAAALFARLNPDVMLETKPDGTVLAFAEGRPFRVGQFGSAAAQAASDLKVGLALPADAPQRAGDGTDIDLLLRRLARGGLLEYRLAVSPKAKDLVVIEPQVADYWPRLPALADDQVLVLSRFALLRRRGNDMILESPRSGALLRLRDPRLAATIADLATPQTVAKLQAKGDAARRALLALLVDCQMLFPTQPERDQSLRMVEGDNDLVLWDFHNLLFHARSTAGRHANLYGGTFLYSHVMDQLPAVRPRWPGRSIDLRRFSDVPPDAASPMAAVLRERHSVRDFDDENPITLAELSRLLDSTARVQFRDRLQFEEAGVVLEIAARPYPSGGGSYELELYLAVDRCEGLARGFYHYDADRHALVPIPVPVQQLDAMLADGQFAMGAPRPPQVLATIAARFGRVSWKYSAISYALTLKHVGVLIQTLYLMTTEMRIGACAIGGSNIDLFAKMTGIEFHVEGPVGVIAIGRSAEPERLEDPRTRAPQN